MVKIILDNGQFLTKPLTDTEAAGNQADVDVGPECDISSSGIFFIGTENARLLTSDCVAPTSINLIDLEPC